MGFTLLKIAVAVAAGFVFLKMGMAVLGSFARPVPPPPDPGELRRVRLTYECSICSTS